MTEDKKKTKSKVNLRALRLSLKYRPELYKLILKMRQSLRRRNTLLKSLKQRLRDLDTNSAESNITDKVEAFANKTKKFLDSSTQTDSLQQETKPEAPDIPKEAAGWNLKENGHMEKSIAEQVKEVAQNALQDTGMVYVESAGMYYDYKTGYYYNSELGLYYHTDTGCYYYYSDDKQFVFHSYPDMSKVNASLIAHQKKKARKLKRERQPEDDIDNLTKNLSQGKEEDGGKPKKARRSKSKKEKKEKRKETDRKSKKSKGKRKTEVVKSKEKVVGTEENTALKDSEVKAKIDTIEDVNSEDDKKKVINDELKVIDAEVKVSDDGAKVPDEKITDDVSKVPDDTIEVVESKSKIAEDNRSEETKEMQEADAKDISATIQDESIKDIDIPGNKENQNECNKNNGNDMDIFESESDLQVTDGNKSASKTIDSINDSNGKEDENKNPDKIETTIDIEMENQDSEEDKDEGELEDGECSETESEDSSSESDASTATESDEDSVAKHHPPCMRVIVRETNLAKLKVGSLFLITKDGGTIGREGDKHAILLRDHNVSRNHLNIRYDVARKIYTATDLGSKNGTILNGVKMSESCEISGAMDVLHGSTIQLGETKLLCHIHPGHATCGQCEPGLLMQVEEEKKAAYTRTVSVKKQHELELARLKNIYAPQRLAIEEKGSTYNDRAQARREAVGSTNHAEKTQSTDLDTNIAPDNKGFKLLQKMGWSKGEGLGKDSQGDTEPVPLISNEGKAGLGTVGAVAPPSNTTKPRVNHIAAATLRLATRTKMLRPPAKAFQDEDDEED